MSILDHPNERSLHNTPVPRTGGIAIVLAVALVFAVGYLSGQISSRIGWLAVLGQEPRGAEGLLRAVRDYDIPNVSAKVLRIIISYVDYVNRVVWQKPSS